jgi:hypothetical protein
MTAGSYGATGSEIIIIPKCDKHYNIRTTAKNKKKKVGHGTTKLIRGVNSLTVPFTN